MWKWPLIVLGLSSPLAAEAGCNSFDADTRTLQIRTQAAKEARAECNASGYAANHNGGTQAASNVSGRRSNTEKLRAFTDLRRQAEYLNNSQQYYGQR